MPDRPLLESSAVPLPRSGGAASPTLRRDAEPRTGLVPGDARPAAGGPDGRDRSASAPPTAGGHRRDIQGMRAVAVGLVVLYHLRPDVLSGGFIGVDVFFVVSGFLIVGSLGREASTTGTVALRRFYARRIRRLLPASTLVLLAVMAATVLVMPRSRWLGAAQDVVASALQVQNWALGLGDGYATATAAVSPLQHYWSLAVEEQFYLLTPVLLVAFTRFAGWLGRSPTAAVTAGVAGLAVLSLVHSVWLSSTHHDLAYFATTTRVWELAVGGLAALAATRLSLPRPVRALAPWLGLAALAGCALTFDTHLPFPGWIAVLPVAATLLLLLGGLPDAPGSSGDGRVPLATRLLGSRVPRFLGDVSYSLYLWHWPVIVFFVFLAQRQPDAVDSLALVTLATLLAWISTRFVEEPLRRPRRASRHGAGRRSGAERSAYRLAVALLALSVTAGALPWAYVVHRQSASASQLLDADHPGGALPLPDRLPPPSDVPVVPDPVVAVHDGPVVYQGDGECGRFDPRTTAPDACVYGDETSPATVLLVGDSHAAMLSPAIVEAGEAQGWRVQAMVRNGCPFTSAASFSGDGRDTDCPAANRLTVERILELRPRVVVTSAMSPDGYQAALGWRWESPEAQVAGFQDMWRPLLDAGIPVVVVRDTPTPDFVAAECVETHGPAADECTMGRAEFLDERSEPILDAAKGTPGVSVIDLTDHLCNAEVCPSVVGNVIVYRDNHITDTFGLSLSPLIGERLASFV